MLVLSSWVTIERSKKEILSRELETLSMFKSEKAYSVELLMLLVTQSMERVQLSAIKELELKLKPQVLSQENPYTSQCRLDLNPVML